MARGMHKGPKNGKEWNSDMLGSNQDRIQDKSGKSVLERRRASYVAGQPEGSTHKPGSNKK